MPKKKQINDEETKYDMKAGNGRIYVFGDCPSCHYGMLKSHNPFATEHTKECKVNASSK
jgi:hypothetical protein